MMEGEAKEVSEADMLQAIKTGHEAIKKQIAAQLELAEKCGGKKPFRAYEHIEDKEEIKQLVKEKFADRISNIARQKLAKSERKIEFGKLKDELKETIA